MRCARSVDLIRAALITFVGCQIALHYYGMLSRENGGNAETLAMFNQTVAYLHGAEPTDPQQTRLFVPALLKIVSVLLPFPSGYVNEKLSLVFVKFLSGAFVVAMFLRCADLVLTTTTARLVSAFALGVAALSSELDVSRLDALFGPGFFLLGLSLLLVGATVPEAVRRPGYIAAVLGLGAFGCSARFDLTMLTAGLGLLLGSLQKRWGLALLFATQGAVACVVFAMIIFAFDVRGLLSTTFWAKPGQLRIAQLVEPGTWLTLGLFFGVAAPLTALALRRMSSVLKLVFVGTLTYSLLLLFVGNVSEYRLWLPLEAVMILSSACFLEDRTPPTISV